MKTKRFKTFILVIVLLLIGLFGFDKVSALNVPQITSFKEEVKEKNALRVEFKSNNSGVDYSYEIININTNKKNTLAGSSKFYVYQNLKEDTTYTVMLRVCSNKSNSYLCSNWTKATAKVDNQSIPDDKKDNELVSPVLNNIEKSTSNSITLNYTSQNDITGIEILNTTTGNTFKTTNKSSYVIKNLGYETYSFKIRSYIKNGDNYIYSDYSNEKSITIESVLDKPTLKSVTVKSESSVILKYSKVTGTGVEILNITTNKKIKTSNKSSYTFKGLKANKTYKFKIRNYKTKNSSYIYSGYSNTKSIKIKKLSGSEKIARAAEDISWSKSTSRSVYHHNYSKYKKFTKWSQLGKARPSKGFMKAYDKVRKNHWSIGSKKWGYYTRIGASCDVFVATAVRYSGYDKSYPFAYGSKSNQQLGYMKRSSKWKKVSSAKRGDVCYSAKHVKIYLGNNKIADAGYHSKRFGRISSGKCSKNYVVYRATK